MHGHIRTRTQRILNAISFAILGLFVAAGTIVLIMVAKGYDFDFKTREVTQNGLVLVGSEPVSANIFLDNLDIGETTPHRMTMSSGQHTISLQRNGYRDWQRSFDLGSGEALWLSYPLLLPEALGSNEVAGLDPGTIIESSLDSSRLSIASGQSIFIYRPDLINQEPQTIDLQSLVPGLTGNVVKLSWSGNSSHLLVEVKDDTSTRYLYLEIAQSPDVQDISSLLDGYDDIRFAPNDERSFYGLRDGSLWQLSLEESQGSRLIAEAVDKYNSFERAVITWSQRSQRAVMHLGSRSVVLDVPPINDLSDLAVSRFNGNFVVGVSGSDIGTYVIESPGESNQRIVEIDRSGSKLIFSLGAAYLLSHSEGKFQVYDFERRRFYSYDLPVQSLAFARWATGAHIVAIANGNQAVIFDFDGQNFQALAPARNGLVLLSPDQEHVIHLAKSKADGLLKLMDTSLVAQ